MSKVVEKRLEMIECACGVVAFIGLALIMYAVGGLETEGLTIGRFFAPAVAGLVLGALGTLGGISADRELSGVR